MTPIVLGLKSLSKIPLIDIGERKDLFVALVILGITLASNLAAGFAVGIITAYILKSDKLTV